MPTLLVLSPLESAGTSISFELHHRILRIVWIEWRYYWQLDG